MGCRGCLIVVAILLVSAALFLGGVYSMLTQPLVSVSSSPIIIPSQDYSVAFDRKWSVFLADLGTDTGSGEKKAATLVITEQEATSKLAEFVRSGQLGIDVQDPQIHFQNDRVRVSGDIDAGITLVNLALQVRIASVDGRAQIVFETVNVGSLDVPETLRKQVIDAMTGGAGSIVLDDLPLDIGGISIGDGELIIRDTRLPQ